MNLKRIMMSEKFKFLKSSYSQMSYDYILYNNIFEMRKTIEMENRLVLTRFKGRRGQGHKRTTKGIFVAKALFSISAVAVAI